MRLVAEGPRGPPRIRGRILGPSVNSVDYSRVWGRALHADESHPFQPTGGAPSARQLPGQMYASLTGLLTPERPRQSRAATGFDEHCDAI